MPTTPPLDTPAFTLDEGTLVREAGGSRTMFRFAAPSRRHLDGGFQLSQVSMIFFDRDGRFVVRRTAESSKPFVLANRAAWAHEVLVDQLARATRAVYEIEHRFEYRRKIVAGELPPLPPEADGSDYWRWIDLDARTLEDRVVRFDFALWARTDGIDATIASHPKFPTDSLRTELELDLLDADGNVQFAKTFSSSLNGGAPEYYDTSVRVDRKTLRTLRFFELRGRTESRAISRLPIDTLG